MKSIKPLVILTIVVLVATAFGQVRNTGSLKGKVRVEVGNPSGVDVIVRQGDREVRRGITDKNGKFAVTGLAPGKYGVTLRKPGLSVGSIENIEVKSGENKSLGDRLILTIDEGSIAFIRGSVFGPDDRSVPNVRIELSRIEGDGSLKKIDGRVTNEIGSFVFRLSPAAAKYRVTAKASGAETVSKDVEIDGAAVYRVALNLKPAK